MRWVNITVLIHNIENGIICEKFVIDGANIAYDVKTSINQPKISNILLLKENLDTIGINNYKIICDRSLFYHIDDQAYYSQLIENKEIIEITGGTKADIFILQYAFRNNAFIISNDQYKEYIDLFGKSWIEEHRISFRIIDDDIYFDKLIL